MPPVVIPGDTHHPALYLLTSTKPFGKMWQQTALLTTLPDAHWPPANRLLRQAERNTETISVAMTQSPATTEGHRRRSHETSNTHHNFASCFRLTLHTFQIVYSSISYPVCPTHAVSWNHATVISLSIGSGISGTETDSVKSRIRINWI